LAYVDVDILERFHCDCILLEPPFPETTRWNPCGEYTFTIPTQANPRATADGEWIIRKDNASMRMPASGYFFDGDWLSDWGSGTEGERIALYAREAERIYKETEYATNLVGYSHGLGLRVPLKPSDNKAIYGFSLSHPVAEADVAEASKSAQDGLGSWQFAGVAVERSAESGEDDVGGGDA
jgi:hypothetical protein